MEPDFWHERWQSKQIGFHQSKPEPLLERYWATLGIAPAATVFVPLCGKSLDMAWLAGRGHRVVGCELSDIAVREFFASQNLVPTTRTEATATIYEAGPFEIWCGDIFALPPAIIGGAAAIYDRAALIALPPDMRKRYARQLIEQAEPGTDVLLITIEYDQAVLAGPPHSVARTEIEALFGEAQVGARWSIEELECAMTKTLSPKFKEAGIDAVAEAVYRLRAGAHKDD